MGCPGEGDPPNPPNQYFSMFFRGLGPGIPWKRSPGTIRTHTDPYGSIRTHPDPSQVNFQYLFGHMLDTFVFCQINPISKKTYFSMKTKVVPIAILCRMHRLSNSGNLFLMILWTSHFFCQGPLSSQIWPSGRELGSQAQGPGSIPPAPLVGSNLCASRQRTLRGLFSLKSPF